jgi:hypothetical protein
MNRHLGYVEQPQNVWPALAPFFAVRSTIQSASFLCLAIFLGKCRKADANSGQTYPQISQIIAN